MSLCSCVIVNVAISSTIELIKKWFLLVRGDRDLDDSDQLIIIGNVASEQGENTVVNEGSNDRDITVVTSSDNSVTNENTVNVKTLERCFNERIDRELSNIVDTVEDRMTESRLHF